MPPNDPPNGGGPSTPALPPGVSILTDEQMTVIVQQAARKEMERLRDTVRANAKREVGGQIDEEIGVSLRRKVGQTLDERIGAVKRTIRGKVREEVGAQLHKFVQGPHITLNKVLACHVVLGGLVHSAVPWIGKKVGGAFSEYVKGAKIERIMGAFYHNAPKAEHFHENFLLKTAQSIFKAPKFAADAHGGELRMEASKIETKVQEMEAKIKELEVQGDKAKYEVSSLKIECGHLKQRATDLIDEASQFEGLFSSFKSDEIEAKE